MLLFWSFFAESTRPDTPFAVISDMVDFSSAIARSCSSSGPPTDATRRLKLSNTDTSASTICALSEFRTSSTFCWNIRSRSSKIFSYLASTPFIISDFCSSNWALSAASFLTAAFTASVFNCRPCASSLRELFSSTISFRSSASSLLSSSSFLLSDSYFFSAFASASIRSSSRSRALYDSISSSECLEALSSALL